MADVGRCIYASKIAEALHYYGLKCLARSIAKVVPKTRPINRKVGLVRNRRIRILAARTFCSLCLSLLHESRTMHNPPNLLHDFAQRRVYNTTSQPILTPRDRKESLHHPGQIFNTPLCSSSPKLPVLFPYPAPAVDAELLRVSFLSHHITSSSSSSLLITSHPVLRRS